MGEFGDRCEAVLNLGYADSSVNVFIKSTKQNGSCYM